MMKPAILLLACLAFFTFKNQAQTVTDYDGNVYNTVVIGSQEWMRENLKVTHYRNGILIPEVTDNITWAGLVTGARCYYNNDSAAYNLVYGALYNWYTVNDSNHICPSQWHVSTDAEWTTLETFLGGSDIAGGKMKETGTVHWITPNAGATNSSGYTGLPGGMRGLSNTFEYIGENGLWWTSTEQSGSGAWSRYLWNMYEGVDRNPAPKTLGLSIRCIKDNNVGLDELKYTGNIKLYPNPSNGIITIDCADRQYLTLSLYTVSGELVIQRELNGGTNEIDISTMARGMYIIKITGATLAFHQKLNKV